MSAVAVFIIGLVIITIGAEALLRGASKIAALLGIRPIVIGLTVVSIGTSLPELAVGIMAVGDGAADIAVGNIAGTNIVNILLILGFSAALRPLPVQIKSIRFEVAFMIGAAFMLLVLSLDGVLSFTDGLLMFCFGIIYLLMIVKKSKLEEIGIQQGYAQRYTPCSLRDKRCKRMWFLNSLYLVAGIAATIWGADLLVSGATSIARAWGMSDAVIGLTIVAIGTSAPELATTLVATARGERDVAVGNLLGSSVTNILIILSTTVLCFPSGIAIPAHILWIDLPLGALIALVCYPVFKSGQRMSRTEGIVFTAAYLVYLMVLIWYRM